ncbi:UNKNOWN [Stylonychia lemnae]|uniref:Uncharacterized protein n=1 Tax=Stylonychia lemnae TaxID=5949 RepID=A0A078AQL8_STYLE|nr:UNKNOWN [Stylonychia lemnae]|eukprot:CDW84730.1 UNKNOWN [Stylonychia lemnae]
MNKQVNLQPNIFIDEEMDCDSKDFDEGFSAAQSFIDPKIQHCTLDGSILKSFDKVTQYNNQTQSPSNEDTRVYNLYLTSVFQIIYSNQYKMKNDFTRGGLQLQLNNLVQSFAASTTVSPTNLNYQSVSTNFQSVKSPKAINIHENYSSQIIINKESMKDFQQFKANSPDKNIQKTILSSHQRHQTLTNNPSIPAQNNQGKGNSTASFGTEQIPYKLGTTKSQKIFQKDVKKPATTRYSGANQKQKEIAFKDKKKPKEEKLLINEPQSVETRTRQNSQLIAPQLKLDVLQQLNMNTMTNRVSQYRNNQMGQKLITQSSASTIKSTILDEKSPMNNFEEPFNIQDKTQNRIQKQPQSKISDFSQRKQRSQERDKYSSFHNTIDNKMMNTKNNNTMSKENVEQDNYNQKITQLMQKFLRGEISKEKFIKQQKQLDANKLAQINPTLGQSQSQAVFNYTLSPRIADQSVKIHQKNKENVIASFTNRMSDYQRQVQQKRLDQERQKHQQQQETVLNQCTFKPDLSLTRNQTNSINMKLISGQTVEDDKMGQEQSQILLNNIGSDFDSFYARQQIFTSKYRENLRRKQVELAEKELQVLLDSKGKKEKQHKIFFSNDDTHNHSDKKVKNYAALEKSSMIQQQAGSQYMNSGKKSSNKSPKQKQFKYNRETSYNKLDISTRGQTQNQSLNKSKKSFVLKNDDQVFKRLSTPLTKSMREKSLRNILSKVNELQTCRNQLQKALNEDPIKNQKKQESLITQRLAAEIQKRKNSKEKWKQKNFIQIQEEIEQQFNQMLLKNQYDSIDEYELTSIQFQKLLQNLKLINKDDKQSQIVEYVIEDIQGPLIKENIVEFLRKIIFCTMEDKYQAKRYQSMLKHREDSKLSQLKGFTGIINKEVSILNISQNQSLNHSFSPKISARNSNLSQKRRQKYLQLLSPQTDKSFGTNNSIDRRQNLGLTDQFEYLQRIKSQRLDKLRKNQQDQEDSQCTFKPIINKKSPTSREKALALAQQQDVFSKLNDYARIKQQKLQKQILQEKAEKEAEIASQQKKMTQIPHKQRRSMQPLKVSQKQSRTPSPDKKRKSINQAGAHKNHQLDNNYIKQAQQMTSPKPLVNQNRILPPENYIIQELNESASEKTTESLNKDNNQQNPLEVPLLHVDIKHGNNQVTRLSIFEGDNVPQIAEDFSKRYDITSDVKEKLIQYVQSQMKRLLKHHRNQP